MDFSKLQTTNASLWDVMRATEAAKEGIVKVLQVEENGSMVAKYYVKGIGWDGAAPVGYQNAVNSQDAHTYLKNMAYQVSKYTWTEHDFTGGTDTVASLAPYTYHVWGEISSLTITALTVVPTNQLGEYYIEFESGSTPTTLSLLSGYTIKWKDGQDLASNIQANKTYRIRITGVRSGSVMTHLLASYEEF